MQPDQHVLPGKRVIVCEDQGITSMHLQAALSAGGMEVIGSAVTGIEAVAVVLETRPDIVIMDIGLPGLDGLAAARQILQAHPVCLVVLSGHGDDAYREEALRLGVDAYLLKPITGQSLLACVYEAWRSFEERTGRQRQKAHERRARLRRALERGGAARFQEEWDRLRSDESRAPGDGGAPGASS